MFVDSGRCILGGRKVTLTQGHVVEIAVDPLREGHIILRCEIVLGEAGTERSWSVEGLMEVAVGTVRMFLSFIEVLTMVRTACSISSMFL